MPSVTYYVALPFVLLEDGSLAAGEAKECPTPSSAVSAARRLAEANAGAVAFSRTGDPAIGEFADALVIERFGETPNDLSEL